MSANDIKVTIHFFAAFSELAQTDKVELFIDSTTSVDTLYQKLAGQFNFPARNDALRVAINEAFSDWQSVLQEGDEIAFIPPVNGG